jgi:hypothetical protein
LFALPKKTITENLSWYDNLFLKNKNNNYILDGSTLYFHSKCAPKNIKEFIKEPKILIILRDPAKRAYSAYLHMKKNIPNPEKRSFDSIDVDINGDSKKTLIKSENQCLNKAILEKLIDINRLDKNYLKRTIEVSFQSIFEDTLWEYKYFQGSIYSDSVEHYQNVLADKVKIIFFEELISRPEYIIDDIWKFIGLKKREIKITHENKTLIPQNFFAKKINVFFSSNLAQILSKILKPLPTKYVTNSILNTFYSSKPKLSRDKYIKIREKMKWEYDYWLSKYPHLQEYWTY